MQMLQFVNANGPEPWKNRDAKRFVRSHAMKDFRRKQRESKKKKIVDNKQPGESTFAVTCLLPERENALDVEPVAKPSSDIPSPTNLVGKYTGPRSTLTTVDDCFYDLLGYASSAQPTCSVLPQIFPLQDTVDCRLPSPSPSLSSNESTRTASPGSISLCPSIDFDLTVCMTVYTTLDIAGANFEHFTKHYFRSVHAYLTFVHRPRFLKQIYRLSKKANAEVALLLLCMRVVAEPVKSNIALNGGELYKTAKNLFRSIYATKGVSLELAQAGVLLSLLEHNASVGEEAYLTLEICSQMVEALGLDALPREHNTVYHEERRRLYWALLSLDVIISLHDEKRERPMLFSSPSLDDVVPSISDADYESAVDEMPSTSAPFIVKSRLPTWADSFSRHGQAVHLAYMTQMIIREKFDVSPDLMISRIERLDSLLVTNLSNLLADCNGICTQYCGPISTCISSSYLLHEYQLLSTMHNTSQAASDSHAATRSKLAIETMTEMMVNILREFPVAHTPELSPTALFCPYKSAMLGLLLDRLSGVQRPRTLVGNTFEMMINGLKHFSTIWPCTAEYVKLIERAQSRALPMPLPLPAHLESTITIPSTAVQG